MHNPHDDHDLLGAVRACEEEVASLREGLESLRTLDKQSLQFIEIERGLRARMDRLTCRQRDLSQKLSRTPKETVDAN